MYARTMFFRTLLAIMICVAAGPTLISAKPTAAQVKKAADTCDAVFDQALDNCLGGGWTPNECLESAASSREQCMREHGIEPRYVPKISADRLLRAKQKAEKANLREVAPATPKPKQPTKSDQGETLNNPRQEAKNAPATIKRKAKDSPEKGVGVNKSESSTTEPTKARKPTS